MEWLVVAIISVHKYISWCQMHLKTFYDLSKTSWCYYLDIEPVSYYHIITENTICIITKNTICIITENTICIITECTIYIITEYIICIITGSVRFAVKSQYMWYIVRLIEQLRMPYGVYYRTIWMTHSWQEC